MIFKIVVGLGICFIIISIGLIGLSFYQKFKHKTYVKKVAHARDYIIKRYMHQEKMKLKVSKRFFFDALIDVDEQIHLDPVVRADIIRDLKDSRFIHKMTKHLHSPIPFKRKMAVFYMSKLRTESAYELMFKQFLKEKNEAVRLRIVYLLRYGMKEVYIKPIIESFVGSSSIYQERLATFLGANYKRIYDVFPHFDQDERFEIKRGLIRIGSFFADGFLLDYMKRMFDKLINQRLRLHEDNELLHLILINMLKFTPDDLKKPYYLNHRIDLLTSYAIKAYGVDPDIKDMQVLIDSFDESINDDLRIDTLSHMLFNNPKLIDALLSSFPLLSDYRKSKVVVLFNERLDYVVLKLYDVKTKLLKDILGRLLDQGMLTAIIDFINHNKDKKIEHDLMTIIMPYIQKEEDLNQQFCMYVDEAILIQFDLCKYVPIRKPREKQPPEKKKIRWMIKWMILSLLVFPVIYIAFNISSFSSRGFGDILKGYVIDVNVYLIVYFGVINTVYIVLLILSFIGSRRQVLLSKTRKSTLLFSERVLPGISIIAPAYNEAMSIIESVTSLLNIKYPNYEVIVVNDGSSDQTLDKLILVFDLERKHTALKYALNTKPVKAVYRTKRIPNLIVIDKENGGKADALNVGINYSNKAYVCGIDADSILEGDALLKLASVMLDDTVDHIALGGNIYPANGFVFDKGKVEKRSIPKEMVCRFQAIEYLRAFTSGRIGWSMMKSLMIISGAFGLFKKELLIETGGYLTSSSKFKKDTVGEDMELVVRLTRQTLEKKEKFKVKYVYNAFCYTELPSDTKSLLKQRNRWQRGLIDILSYHRKIGFNPTYKQIGMIGYPYFFIFEFLGPFFEVQGYIMLIIGLIMGWLNATIILAILVMSILFGMVISLSSLVMSEKELLMMNKRETLVMAIFAIIENFGYRQMISLHRITSTFSALKETGNWGTQKRKGFNT